MSYSTLFFDLDATLYPASNGLWDEIRKRIFQYMQEEVGLQEAEIPATRDYYWKTYGTTLEGLRIHHDVDPDDYLKYVHNIPLDRYLSQDPELDSLLRDLPQDLWVFTNADWRHAQAVLSSLGIQERFSGIVDLIAMDFIVKPNPDAYRIALELAGADNPTHCILFDDLVPNLEGAKQQGFTTVLVGDNGKAGSVDYQLPSIHHIKDVLPHLWVGAG
jgi:putative hydrolase of the HAD superfamily